MSDHVLIFRLACYVFVYPGLILLLKTKSNPSIWLLCWLNVFSSEVKPQPFQLGGASAGWASRTCPCPQVEDLTQDSLPFLLVPENEPAKIFCKFLADSFSAVSNRNFARKYAFDNIFQALQDLHTFAPLQSRKIRKKIGLKKQQFLWNFCNILANVAKITKWCQISKIFS